MEGRGGDTDVSSNTADVNIRDTFLSDQRLQPGLALLGVIEEGGVGVNVWVDPLVDDVSPRVFLEVLVKVCSPAVLDTVARPEDLLHLRWSLQCHGSYAVVKDDKERSIKSCLESDSSVELWRLGARAEPPQLDVVNEGDVVGGMPVQAVAVEVEGHRVEDPVNGGHHLQ